jgi:hypothetical protein
MFIDWHTAFASKPLPPWGLYLPTIPVRASVDNLFDPIRTLRKSGPSSLRLKNDQPDLLQHPAIKPLARCVAVPQTCA